MPIIAAVAISIAGKLEDQFFERRIDPVSFFSICQMTDFSRSTENSLNGMDIGLEIFTT